MLDILEKIQYGVAVVVVAGSVVLYALWGPAGGDAKSVNKVERLEKHAPAAASRTKGEKSAAAPAPSTAAEDVNLLDRLAKEQGLKPVGGEVEHVPLKVPKDLHEYLKREANYMAELDKAGHEFLTGPNGETRLKVTGIEDESILKKVGFESDDIIEFIDGERIDFGGSSAMDHVARYKRLMQKLEKGAGITLTVTRGGKPMQMEFKL